MSKKKEESSFDKSETGRVYVKTSTLKSILFCFTDFIIIFLVYLVACLSVQSIVVEWPTIFFILAVALFSVLVFLILGIYNALLDHISILDEIKMAIIITLVNVLVKCAVYLPWLNGFSFHNLDVWTMVILNLSEVFLLISTRLVSRVVRFYNGSLNKNGPRTMIVGAGSTAKMIYSDFHTNKNINNKIVVFIDDDPNKIGKKFLGSPVVGPISNAKEYIEKYQVKEVIIAIAGLTPKALKDIIHVFSTENVIIKRVSLLSEVDQSGKLAVKEVSMAELLGREQITFDMQGIRDNIRGQRVLVTGAGGSIGSELVTQIYESSPSLIILFDIYENSTYDVQQNLLRRIKREGSDVELVTIIGSTYNEVRVNEIFDKYSPELIFHAAAYKHVPLMEDSPVEAIRTNVIGTYNVAKAAMTHKAIKMTLVSTDKAVRPTNTMGATKSFAEMIIRYFDSIAPDTAYSAVRFGNVLGSNGSVIPLFRKQIAEGGPVTVTHKDIIRFFMTIPEAVSLILQSMTYAKGGEIFILDMGEPVKILTLAENVIRQCGYVPYKDIDIVFTGLRPGEKLYEELLLRVTDHDKTENSKIYIEKSSRIRPIEEDIAYIRDALTKTDNDEIKHMLQHVVTSYTNYKEFNKIHGSHADEARM